MSKKYLILAFTWLLRLAVGATFTISGFVKAIDPWGTLYKFQDYMGSMGLPSYDNLLLVGVFALCAYEFCVGIFFIFGCFRRSTPIAAILMMGVMLPLTLWIAVANPVDDCGCFGDAIILSNWATFWKNVILVAAIIWLLIFNSRCRCLIRPFVQWIAMLASIAYIVIIGFIGYAYQPLLDFRPFKIGAIMADNLTLPENADPEIGEGMSDETEAESADEAADDGQNMIFVYAKNGVEKHFGIDDELPDEADGWTFVRREDNADPKSSDYANSGNNAAESAAEKFQVWSEDGNEEVTSDVMRSRGGQILLLMPDLKKVSLAMTWKINSLYAWATENKVDMIGIMAATPKDVEEWKDISLASYQIYTAEDTQIKMLARGNPAVVYLNDGKIIWKSSLKALDTDDSLDRSTRQSPELYAHNDYKILRKITEFYLMILGVLILLSLLPLLGQFFPNNVRTRIEESDAKIREVEIRRLKNLNRDGKEDHEGLRSRDKSAQ